MMQRDELLINAQTEAVLEVQWSSESGMDPIYIYTDRAYTGKDKKKRRTCMTGGEMP